MTTKKSTKTTKTTKAAKNNLLKVKTNLKGGYGSVQGGTSVKAFE